MNKFVYNIEKIDVPHRKAYKTFRVEGNKGYDYLLLQDRENDMITLDVGQSGVKIINKIVPVEFLVALISNALLENNNDIKEIINSFNFSEYYKKYLIDKFEENK